MPKATYALSPKQKKELLLKGRTDVWTRTIFGQPYSKANGRRLKRINGVSRLIKSEAALAYAKDFLRQCPILDPLFEAEVSVEIDIYYASERPDLDPSLILDLLQGRIYRNDRQARSQRFEHYIDRDNPRIDIRVSRRETAKPPQS